MNFLKSNPSILFCSIAWELASIIKYWHPFCKLLYMFHEISSWTGVVKEYSSSYVSVYKNPLVPWRATSL